MQSGHKVEDELSRKQHMSDQMDTDQFDANRTTFKRSERTEEFLPSPTYQIDPNDAILLLRDPLLLASSSSSADDQERTAIDECVKRLHECEKLVESVKLSSGQPVRRFTLEDFVFVNKFVADSEAVLKSDCTDDKTWGSNVPEALVLKDMLGGLPLSNIGDDETFHVRGVNYLVDGKKVPAATPLFFLRGLQVVEQPKSGPGLASHVAMQEWCGFPKSHDQYNEWLILNYMVPGATQVNVVCLFTASREALEVINSIGADGQAQPNDEPYALTPGHPDSHPHYSRHSHHSRHSHSHPCSPAHSPTHSHTHKKTHPKKPNKHILDSPHLPLSPQRKPHSWANSLVRFYTGTDAYRNRTFKLFPRMVKASWAIQAAVGTKPALIGNKKLELKYFRGPGYLEVDIDLSSSTIATHILGMVRGVSKSMVVDLGVGLEGTQEDELPEAILGQTRFDKVDLDSAVPVPLSIVLGEMEGDGGGSNCNSGGTASESEKHKSSKSTFKFGWGTISTDNAGTSSTHKDNKEAAEDAEVNAPIYNEYLQDTPAQKLRRALAVGTPTSAITTPLGR